MQETEHKLVEEAAEHFRADRIPQAEKLYRRMLADEPENPQVLTMLGICRQRQQDADAALGYFREASRHGDNEARCHFLLGRHLVEMGRYEEGREALSQAIALQPNHAPARTLLGFAWLREGDSERAVSELRAACRADPQYTPASTQLAAVLLEQGQLDEAEKLAGRAVQLQPDDPGAQSVMGRVLLAKGHPGFAEQAFRNALEKHPDNPELRAGYATARWQSGGVEEAAGIFSEVARSGFRPPEMMRDFARCLLDLGRVEPAREILEALHGEGYDDHGAAVARIRAHLAAGDAAAARRALTEFPQDAPEAGLLDARCLILEGDRVAARRRLEARLEADGPDARQARLMLAELVMDDDVEAAGALLAPMIHTERPDDQAVSLEIRRLRAGGQWQALADLLAGQLERDTLPDQGRASYRLLRLEALDQAGDYAAAADLIEESATQEPGFVRQFSHPRHMETASAWEAASDEDFARFPRTAPDDGRRAPVWILGWPGTGRGTLLQALMAHPGLHSLDPNAVQQRLEGLGYPLAPADIDEPDPARAQSRRRHYLGRVPADKTALETGWSAALALPTLASVFPGARVIVLAGAEEDLHLHWSLHGYRDTPEMLSAYRSDRRLFTALRDRLPLEVTLIARHRLREDPEGVLRSTLEALDLEFEQVCLDALTAVQRFYRGWPDGHWRNYAEVLGRD